MWRIIVKQIRRMRVKEIRMGKMEGIKRGGVTICRHLFISNPCNHFHINMLKWQSSIFGFRKKFPTTFIIH
jgi:hypothetical protein